MEVGGRRGRNVIEDDDDHAEEPPAIRRRVVEDEPPEEFPEEPEGNFQEPQGNFQEPQGNEPAELAVPEEGFHEPAAEMQKDGPPELTACDNCRLTDTDIKPHISGNYITPCPSYFEEFKIYDHRMEPVAEEAVCNACLSYMDHINVAIPVFGEITKVLENPYGADGIFGGPAGREKRAIIRHFWRVVASFSGIVGQVEQHQNIDVAAKDADTLAQYRAMLEHVVEPFRGLQMSDANRGILNTLFYNGVYERIAGFTHNLFGAFAIFEDYVKASVQAMTVDEPVAIDHKNFVAIQRNKILAMQAAQKIVMNPPEIVIDPNDPDINRDRVAALVRNILVQSGAVIVNTNDPSNVLVALPELKNGQFYYTYSPSMTISEALQRLKVDASVSHVYAKYMTDISRQIHTYHENSVLRLSRNDFVCKMRYISWRNGVLCCITGIFYYRRDCFDPRMPANYSHFTDELEKINRCPIRAMKFIDKDLDYFQVMMDLLGGKYRREHDPIYKEEWENQEEVPCSINDGGNGYLMNLEKHTQEQIDDQGGYMLRRLEEFDLWINDKDFLRTLDVLDVKLKSCQKIFQDQKIDRNAYRVWLETIGRSLSGILGHETRYKHENGAQRYLEKELKTEINDRLEYAAVFFGAAGTGKSTLLEMLMSLIDEPLQGVMSDHKRPIALYNTIVGKAVIIAADYQTDQKDPSMPSGDLKKAVSQEKLVSDRLHKDSEIIRFLAQFIFATNVHLPFHDNRGDMMRRFVHWYFRYQIPLSRQNFDDDDERTVMDVFNEEDIGRFAIIACLEHKRRLLNVGKRSFYKCDDKNEFKIPRYLLETQAEFIRQQNTLVAFITSLRNRFSYGQGCEDEKADRAAFINEYKEYCDMHKCEQYRDDKVDAEMVKLFNVRMDNTFYFGIFFQPAKQPAEQPAEQQDDDIGI